MNIPLIRIYVLFCAVLLTTIPVIADLDYATFIGGSDHEWGD